MEEFYEDEIKNKEAEAKAVSEALRIVGIVAAVLIVATISLLAVIL